MIAQLLRTRLLTVSNELLTAVAEGGPALEKFNDLWSSLCSDVEAAIEIGLLDDETISLAHAASTSVAIFASAFHDLCIINQNLTSDLIGELESTFSRLSLSECVDYNDSFDKFGPATNLLPLSQHNTQISLLDQVVGAAPFEQSATSWLSANLHNPYPPRAVKHAISCASHVPIKTVSAWFKDTRKQIGWNALRLRRFEGSREEMLRAARGVFLGDSLPDIAQSDLAEFMSIKDNVTAMVDSLHRPEQSMRSSLELNTASLSVELLSQSSDTSDPYDSSGSPHSSRTPSLTFSTSDESGTDSAGEQCSGVRKRRRQASEDDNSALQSPTRAVKRVRPHFTPKDLTVSSSAEPAESVTNLHAHHEHRCWSMPSVPDDDDVPYGRPHKRGFEDDDSDVIPAKRPRVHQTSECAGSLATHSGAQTCPSTDLELTSDISTTLDIRFFSDWSSLGALDRADDHGATVVVSAPVDRNVHAAMPDVADISCPDYSLDDLFNAFVHGTSLKMESLTAFEAMFQSTNDQEAETTAFPSAVHSYTTSPSLAAGGPSHLESLLVDQSRSVIESPLTTSDGDFAALPLYNGDAIDTLHDQSFPCQFSSSTDFIGDITTFDWNAVDTSLLQTCDTTTIPPPPYDAIDECPDIFYDVALGKTELVNLQAHDGNMLFGAVNVDTLSMFDKVLWMPEIPYDTQPWINTLQTC